MSGSALLQKYGASQVGCCSVPRRTAQDEEGIFIFYRLHSLRIPLEVIRTSDVLTADKYAIAYKLQFF
jgi:hypothetical protein